MTALGWLFDNDEADGGRDASAGLFGYSLVYDILQSKLNFMLIHKT